MGMASSGYLFEQRGGNKSLMGLHLFVVSGAMGIGYWHCWVN